MAKPLSSVASTDPFIISHGRLLPGDCLSLAAGLSLTSGRLLDNATGARHPLHGPGQTAIDLLQAPIPVERWLVRLTDAGASPAQVAELIGFLDGIGGLRIKRSLRRRLAHFWNLISWSGAGYRATYTARRYRVTPIGLFVGCTRAALPVLLLIPAAAFLLYGAGVDDIAGWALAAAFAFWASIVMHEGAHSLPLLGSGRPVLLQRGMRLGLLHRPVPAGRDRLSALAGPAAGIATALLIAPNIIGWVTGAFHLLSLLPDFGDGRSLLARRRGVRT
jgi:hypothetical protein